MAAYFRIPWLVIVAMSIGMMGAEAMVGPFWAIASAGIAGPAVAATIAVINSIGNLGGYFGPSIIGLVKSMGGGIQGGLLAIGAVLGVSACLALAVKSRTRPAGDSSPG
jgi:ACS family tartrate transporter-like MFS transporter